MTTAGSFHFGKLWMSFHTADPTGKALAASTVPPTRSGFRDLRSAGRELALKLDRYAGDADVLVVAIVLGGVPVAIEVARALNLDLDLLIVRRLLISSATGKTVCAVNVCGVE